MFAYGIKQGQNRKMKRLFLIALGLIGALFVIGYISNPEINSVLTENSNPTRNFAIEEAELSLNNITSDKKLYHSSDVMNLTAIIYSDRYLENVSIFVRGINKRLNEERTLSLERGINKIQFTHKLPRCNVCGGIKAGDYDITCEVVYGNITLTNSTTVNIQQ